MSSIWKLLTRKETIFLSFVLTLSAFARLLWLDSVPTGFFRDEALMGWEAYNLLIGRMSLPVHVLIAHSLQTLLFVHVFGLCVFAVRLPYALYGIGTVFLTYLLAKEMFNERVGLLASLFLAISPWHIQFSRIGFPPISLPFYFTLGFWLLYRGVKRSDRRFLWLSSVAMGLSLYTYGVSRIFIPVFLIGFVALRLNRVFHVDFAPSRMRFHVHVKVNHVKTILWNCAIWVFLFILVTSPIISFTLQQPTAREYTAFESISIMHLGLSPCETAVMFIKNYISYFSQSFLFLNGDANLRHSTQRVGQLYLFDILLFVPAVILCMVKRKFETKLLLLWLGIYPVTASLMWEGTPHALRSIVGLPCFQIMSAYFLAYVLDHGNSVLHFCFISPLRRLSSLRKTVQRKLFRVLRMSFLLSLSILIPLCSAFYAHIYFSEYPQYSGEAFDYGYEQVVDFILSNHYEQRQLWIHEYWWSKILVFFFSRDQISDVVTFVNLEQGTLSWRKLGALFLAKDGDLEYLAQWGIPFKELKIVYYPDGKIAFHILELQDRVGWMEDTFTQQPDKVFTAGLIEPKYSSDGDVLTLSGTFTPDQRGYLELLYNLNHSHLSTTEYNFVIVKWKSTRPCQRFMIRYLDGSYRFLLTHASWKDEKWSISIIYSPPGKTIAHINVLLDSLDDKTGTFDKNIFGTQQFSIDYIAFVSRG